MALSHLKAAGVKSPTNALASIYESQKPGQKDYLAEVQSFKTYFEESYEMWAYLKAIKKAAGNDANLFRKLYDDGTTSARRKNVMVKMSASGAQAEQEAAARYLGETMAMPRFNPPRRDEYLARFVDTTQEEDVAAYEEAFRVAKETLVGRWH